MAVPCDEYPLLIMMEYYRRPGDLCKNMGRRWCCRHERQLRMIDNPIHNGIPRDESEDLHRPPALGANIGNRKDIAN